MAKYYQVPKMSVWTRKDSDGTSATQDKVLLVEMVYGFAAGDGGWGGQPPDRSEVKYYSEFNKATQTWENLETKGAEKFFNKYERRGE